MRQSLLMSLSELGPRRGNLQLGKVPTKVKRREDRKEGKCAGSSAFDWFTTGGLPHQGIHGGAGHSQLHPRQTSSG
jgi:hypothetical protein